MRAAASRSSRVAIEQHYTVGEVCRLLRVSRSTVYGLFRAGELSSVMIGRARRVPASDLARWLEARRA